MRPGSFELVEELSTGSCGTVWSERKTGDSQASFALKILAEWALEREGEERFRDEMTLFSSLDHANIVASSETGVVQPIRSKSGSSVVVGAPWYAMDRALGALI
jgi:hypothetical protein